MGAMACAMGLLASCDKNGNGNGTDEVSPIVGKWNVPAVETDENETFVSGPLELVWEAEEGTKLSFLPVESIPALANQFGSILLTQVLKDVTFENTGDVIATYNEAEISLETPSEPVWAVSEKGYATFKLDGNDRILLFLNIDKLNEAGSKADENVMDEILAFVNKGVKLNWSLNGSELKIFIDKAYMTEIAAFAPKIAGLIPDDPDALGSFGPMVKAILSDLPNAMTKTTKFELSLTLKK